jgi:hypothetical protein
VNVIETERLLLDMAFERDIVGRNGWPLRLSRLTGREFMTMIDPD